MRLARQLARLAVATGLLCLLGTPAAARGEATSSRYILIAADDDSLPAGLAQQVAAHGGSITDALPEIGVAIATSADADFAASASSIEGLRSVIPDVVLAQERETEALVENPPTSGDDDQFFDMQWALDAIDAPEAWAAGARGAGARVAVLDTGIDVDHPDLAPNLNLALSTSFVPGVPVAAPPAGPPSFTGPPHHGTWTAGIIAGADNGLGTIGVAPEAELVAIRVGTDSGGLVMSAVLPGIVYAANVDADVINMSFGALLSRRGFTDTNGDSVSATEVAELSVAYTRALEFAHRQRATIIASAGNEAHDFDADQDALRLPTQSPHVIAVAATGPRGWGADPSTDLDLPACYSNYGRSVVDLAAPGGNRDCTLRFPPPSPWSFCTVVITLPCFAFDLVAGPTVNGWSANFGTSAAAPHVAGVAALVIGAHGGQMDPDAVEAILRASADDLGTPGVDPRYGHGRVNAARAVGLK